MFVFPETTCRTRSGPRDTAAAPEPPTGPSRSPGTSGTGISTAWPLPPRPGLRPALGFLLRCPTLTFPDVLLLPLTSHRCCCTGARQVDGVRGVAPAWLRSETPLLPRAPLDRLQRGPSPLLAQSRFASLCVPTDPHRVLHSRRPLPPWVPPASCPPQPTVGLAQTCPRQCWAAWAVAGVADGDYSGPLNL